MSSVEMLLPFFPAQLKTLSGTWFYAFGFLGDEGTPDSVNPSVVDEEEGLPSPPLDEGAFFATQPTSMELSQVCFHFFWFMFRL